MEKVVYNYLTDQPMMLPERDITRLNKIRITFKNGFLKEQYPQGLVGYYRAVNSQDLRIGIAVTNYSLSLYKLDKRKDRNIIVQYDTHGFDVLDIERITEIIPPAGEIALHYWISENKNKNFFDRK
ncbi:MAG: hypothetical protein HYZ14_04935 [Bacteroidetes bacterium]|nr:hypothetical protein [Bacteroidota bacterium]